MPDANQQSKPPQLGPTEENPEEWVGYLQQMLNWFYQMQVVPQDGKYDHTTRNAVEHLRGQLGLSAEPVVDERLWQELDGSSGSTGGDGGEVGEAVDRSVDLVHGDEETSWAAAIAMVATSNNNPQTLDTVLATSPQRQRSATDARQLAAEHFALRAQTCQAGQAGSWAGVLRAHGALWVSMPTDEYHVFVVAGIKTDGDTVKVHVLDPRTGYDDWSDFASFHENYHVGDGNIDVLAAG